MLSVRREGVRRQHGDTVVYSEPRTTSRASVLPTWANVGLGLRGRPARASTSTRMAFHLAALAAGRPLARGPPALARRRAFRPTGVRLSIPAFRDFAHVGKIPGPRPRKRLPLDHGKRVAGQLPELPTRTSTRDSLQGRSRRGAATPRPSRRPRSSAPP